MKRSHTSIIFAVPDVRELSALVRLVLRHRGVLLANGFPTSVICSSTGGPSRWISEEIRVDTTEPGADFLQVLAEDDRKGFDLPGRKVVLSHRIPPEFSDDGRAEWLDRGVEAAVAMSRPVKAAIEARFRVPTALIFPSVDRIAFSPARKERAIAYMPDQKDSAVRRILDRLRGTGYSLFPIEGQTPSGVAEILSRASIFLATGVEEGFGLASLEAMACGCLVVGFATQGGREFMEDGSNCLLAPYGDCDRTAQLLELATVLTDEGRTSDLVGEAMRTARKFSPGRETVEILRFWRTLLEARTPGSALEFGPGESGKGQP